MHQAREAEINRKILSGLTFRDLSREYGIPKEEIRKIYFKQSRKKNESTPSTEALGKQYTEIYEKILSGQTYIGIAREYGLRVKVVKGIFYRLQKKKSKPVNRLHARNSEIYQKIISGKTLAHAAQEHGLSRERVRQIFLKQGGDTKEVVTMRERKSAKEKADKYRSLFKIAQEQARWLGLIPSKEELIKFLGKNGDCSHSIAIRIRKELFKKVNLPSHLAVKAKLRHEKMLEDLRRIHRIVKRRVSKKDLIQYRTWRYTSYRQNFGTFKHACFLAGIPIPKRGGWWRVNAKRNMILLAEDKYK